MASMKEIPDNALTKDEVQLVGIIREMSKLILELTTELNQIQDERIQATSESTGNDWRSNK